MFSAPKNLSSDAGTTTTDGILDESDAEDMLPRGAPAAEPEIDDDPESLKRRILEKNQKTIQLVKQHLVEGSTNSAKFRNQVLKLMQSYFIKAKLPEADIGQLRRQMADNMASEEGLLDGLCRLVYETFAAERETRFCNPDGSQRKEPLNLLSYVITLCQNYSDQSDPFALALSKCSWALKLCSGMQTEWADSHLARQLPEPVDKRLRQSLGVVYNLLFKGESEIFFNLKEYNFVVAAQPYLNSPIQHFRFSAFLVLVFSCNEEEASRLLISEKSLAVFLVDNLGLARQSATRRSTGYHVIELAKCALQFTKNEQNKWMLVESGILPVLNSMLQSPADKRDEISAALKILLSLSFDQKCCDAIKEQCGPKLKTLRARPEWKGDRDLDGIRYNTEGAYSTDSFVDEREETGGDAIIAVPPRQLPSPEGKQQQQNTPPDKKKKSTSNSRQIYPSPPAAAPPAPPMSTPMGGPPAPPPPPPPPGEAAADVAATADPGHLMISYHQHSSGEFVRWICPQLTGNNFKVWVDYEQMQESTLDCMAQAVEKSAAVLMCVCKGYKESDFCRLEAEYAIRRRKLVVPLMVEEKYRADGWLGIIMGTKLYYNFSKDKTQSLNSLVSFLKQKFQREGSDWPTPVAPIATSPSTTVVKPEKQQQQRETFADWSADEVSKWLLDKKLPSHLESYRLEGRHLRFLLRVKGQAPEAFYRMLQKSLKLSLFHDIYDFVDALEQL